MSSTIEFKSSHCPSQVMSLLVISNKAIVNCWPLSSQPSYCQFQVEVSYCQSQVKLLSIASQTILVNRKSPSYCQSQVTKLLSISGHQAIVIDYKSQTVKLVLPINHKSVNVFQLNCDKYVSFGQSNVRMLGIRNQNYVTSLEHCMFDK